MNHTQIIKLRRKKTAVLFGSACYLCKKRFGKNFHFHHIGYRDDEKTHADFNSWVMYNEYILPVIHSMPEKFALLCKTCHHLITILQVIKDDARFERIVDLARRSRP